jgi:hypothetical protein
MHCEGQLPKVETDSDLVVESTYLEVNDIKARTVAIWADAVKVKG